MRPLQSGENSVIEAEKVRISIHCQLDGLKLGELDVSAFILAATGKVRGDEDFIFYNQPKLSNGSIALVALENEHQYFDVELNKLDDDVQKIAFVITSPIPFRSARLLSIKVEGVMDFLPQTKVMAEKSLILAELYRYQGSWKFRALGQGFQGGLAPLATGYGVDIEQEQENNLEPIASATPPQTPSANTAKASIPLTKVSVDLTKPGDRATICLAKGNKITAKLKWETNADLDLYCFYVTHCDEEDKVYYRKLGSLSRAPYIKLYGDSLVAGEEILEMSQPEHLKYALIAAYSAVSNGIGSFYSYKARVIVSDGANQEVTAHLSHKDPYSYWVAFALIDFTSSGELIVRNVETYSNQQTFERQFLERTGQKAAGLSKQPNKNVNGVDRYDPERSPYLFKDGSFMMSVGVVEFK